MALREAYADLDRLNASLQKELKELRAEIDEAYAAVRGLADVITMARRFDTERELAIRAAVRVERDPTASLN